MGTVLKRSGSAYASKPWLGSYDFWVPATVPYPKQPVYRALEIGAANFPDRAATMFFGAEMSFRELRDRALRMATALRGFGISKGDRVGIMLPNCPQFPISFFGVLRAGATVVSINPTYTPREVERLAQDSGIRMLIVMDLIAASLVGSIANSRIENVVVTPLHSYMPDAVAARYVSERESQIPTVDSLRRGIGGLPGNHPAFHGFDEIIQSTQPEHFQADVGPDDIAALQYTGGTTGTPKGAMLTHHNLFANTIQSVVWRSFFASPEGERALMVIPLFHVYGMTIGMLLGALQGSTLILIPKFDADLLLDAIARYKPTFFPAVPTLYVALLNHPRSKGTDFSSVRYFNSGSAPLPLDVVERFEQMTGSLIRQGYGLSETSPTTHSTPQLGPRKPESCGIPFPDTECKIVDLETGEQEMPVNELGEVCIRGPQVMKGYWNQQEETARALRPDPHGGAPWFYTGDIGKMDEDGYFYIVQRKKDMIIVSGFNVYPNEVEEVLYSHPAVMEAGVIGIKDDYRGERVKAYVALKPGAAVTQESLIEFCSKGLARYKVPAEIEFLDSLPKTAVGKILHRSLREIESGKPK